MMDSIFFFRHCVRWLSVPIGGTRRNTEIEDEWRRGLLTQQAMQ